MSARTLLVALVAVLLAAAPLGCGGDGATDARDASSEELADNRSAGEDSQDGGGRDNGEAAGGGGADTEDPNEDGDDETGDVEDEEPTANNQVLLGAQFFGERPAGFGVVAIGDAKTIAFDVKAFGEARTLGAISVVGDAATDFRLDAGSCTVGSEIQRGESCTLRVTFVPTAEGIRKAALRIEVDPGVGGGRSLEGGAPPAGADDGTRTSEEEETEPGPAEEQTQTNTGAAQPSTTITTDAAEGTEGG